MILFFYQKKIIKLISISYSEGKKKKNMVLINL